MQPVDRGVSTLYQICTRSSWQVITNGSWHQAKLGLSFSFPWASWSTIAALQCTLIYNWASADPLRFIWVVQGNIGLKWRRVAATCQSSTFFTVIQPATELLCHRPRVFLPCLSASDIAGGERERESHIGTVASLSTFSIIQGENLPDQLLSLQVWSFAVICRQHAALLANDRGLE